MNKISKQTQYHIFELILLILAMTAGGVLITCLFNPFRSFTVMFLSGMVFTASLILSIRLWIDPDRIRANQSEAMLNLASETLATMDEGLNEESAQHICEILLPATRGIAVAMTDRSVILGYAGRDKDLNPTDAPIRTIATHATIADGKMRVMRSAEEIGFPNGRHVINAAIIVPLIVSGETVGTLKFYYPSARNINETQQSIAAGFGELLSSQMAAAALEEQKKLATSMELKALQSQINPHFLFNTINTISSFIRTEPSKARVLLREFATFYRRTLEDSSDLISLTREVDQTQRYLYFEIARFGEERLQMKTDVPVELQSVLVPAFVVQPLVENAVKHAMPSTGCLHIDVRAHAQGDDLVLEIIDDGVGMSEEKRQNIMSTDSQTGLGIAVRNVNDRIRGYYGSESYMDVKSEEGHGTTVTLFLKGGCSREMEAEAEKRAQEKAEPNPLITHTMAETIQR